MSLLISFLAVANVNPSAISDADVARSREDPRFKQILLARGLEQLLDSLYRLQASSTHLDPDGAHHMREGALVAVQLADLIRAIDDQLARHDGNEGAKGQQKAEPM